VITLRDVRAVVTDIEGTTSSLAFVKEQLFPYARQHLSDYVQEHASELGDIVAQVRAAAGREQLDTQALIPILLRWMDEDKKVTPLKSLQGMIWKAGYERGELTGHIYADAVRAMRQWQADGIRIYIYSSGSIEAQRLLFSHTSFGDLTSLISGYFDTTTGPKLEPHSYAAIAAAVGVPAGALLFLSDHGGETAAAAAAGLQTVLVAREQRQTSDREPVAMSFDDLALGR
jgi:enolase-phosphatase E1